MKHILVVNVNWIGDVIFSSAVFMALREAYPDARIVCMAVPRVKPILECVTAIDEIIVYDENGEHANLWGKLSLIWQLRQKKFDAAYLLHRSMTRALLMFCARIPLRMGYDTKGRGIFLTHKVKLPKKSLHRMDEYLNVVERSGIQVRKRATVLTIDSGSHMELEGILESKGINNKDGVIVIHPGGNWELKKWPVNNFVNLINRLSKETQAKIAISGERKERDLAEAIQSQCSFRPVVLAGEISLKQAVALMKRARLVISADSGPLHIANSIGTDVIGLFGPTRPEITGPRGSGRSIVLQHDVGCNREPCYFLTCSDNICMQAVTVEEVIKAVKQLMKKET